MRGKVFLIGFEKEDVGRLREVLGEFDVREIPEYCRDWILQEIVEKADKLRGDGNWHVRKFLLMHDVDNEAVKDIIGRVKALGHGRVIFATTTPASLTWRLEDLIKEWLEEDEHFRQMKRSRFYLDITGGKG